MRKVSCWQKNEDGFAASEFALIFPLLFFMLIGVWDVGNGLLVNQKVIAASQIVIDLIGRQKSVSDAELDQAFQAGSLALMPYSTATLVLEVASVEFDEDDEPQVVWQEASDGSAGEPGLVTATTGLGTEGGGAIAVEARYEYEPLFTGFIINNISMRERIFSRGRQSAIVARE